MPTTENRAEIFFNPPKARRVSEYHNCLTDALECTPDDHDDRRRLKVIIERIEQVLDDVMIVWDHARIMFNLRTR